MAPVNGSYKPRRTAVSGSSGSGRTASKPIVPALPLRFVKRPGEAAPPASTSAAAAATVDDDDEDSNDQEPSSLGSQAMATPHVAHSFAQNGCQSEDQSPADASSQSVDAAGAAPVPSVDLMAPAPPTETSAKPHSATAANRETAHNPVQSYPVKPALPGPPPSASPTRYQVPPHLQPAGRPMGVLTNGNLPHGHRPPLPPSGPPHMHQAHASSGSLHFGAFQDSQSSSPAPPRSGGIAPPPGMPIPDGRAPHRMHLNGNGFPPVMPLGAEMMPGATFDAFGRPAAMAFGPVDYPLYGNALGPSTPHSFQDSQSSAHPEEAGLIHQYPYGVRNGAGGPGDDQAAAMGRMYRPYEYARMMPNPPGVALPPHMMAPGDNADNLVGHLQRHFASPELADCTLELRYADDRAPPVRIPGHRLIFARSYRLFDLLRKQTLQTAPTDGSPQTLLLETRGNWIRSDSFYMAVQRLYGLPLLHGPPHRSSMDEGNVTDAGSANDQFQFAISYAAAGHLLEWGSVLRRGCEVATHLLSWQTLERALEFALERYADGGMHESFKYGEGSRILLNAAVTFIVHNFPSHFSLDVESTEPVPYARLPFHLLPPAPADGAVSSAGAEVPVQLGKGRWPQKISGIQFGDLSFAESRNGGSTETPRATQPAQPAFFAVLSRILLGIPFTQLKMILESSGSGNVNGWANAEARYRIIKTAVDERESRRRRVLEAILTNRVPDAEMIRAGLGSPEPRDLGPWTALGWQEEVLPFGNPDGPSLARKWVPLMEAQNSGAEYP